MSNEKITTVCEFASGSRMHSRGAFRCCNVVQHTIQACRSHSCTQLLGFFLVLRLQIFLEC